jgi:hypothetical protein
VPFGLTHYNEYRLDRQSRVVSKPGSDRTVVKDTDKLRRVVHEVHLIDAMQVQGIPGWLKLPSHVEAVTNSIPRLLLPFVGTVVGTMIQQREIEWVVSTNTTFRQVFVPQRAPIFDPAIVIGSIVLTGWETDEHSAPGWWARLNMALARR